mmetsp:Transcript_16435/g.27869  ORF Transcript_16435/g.27869 Transcript_16435/m.27869 type:complete len:104 (+) Transcript_16435:688-999(+)
MHYCLPETLYLFELQFQIEDKKGIGLIPMPGDPNSQVSTKREGEGDVIETEGLKWNVGSNYYCKTLSWDEMISTSNEADPLSSCIKVYSSQKSVLVSFTIREC